MDINQTITKDFRVSANWSSGFTGKIDLTNNYGSNIDEWTIEFEAPFEIDQLWDAEIISHEGNKYVLRFGDNNQTLAPGDTTTITFNANKINGEIVPPENYYFDTLLVESTSGTTTDDNSADPTPMIDSDMDVDFRVSANWSSGFTGKIDLTNDGGSNVNGWTIEFEAPFEIDQLWDAEIISHEGNRYVLSYGYNNQNINPGESTTITFNANKINGEIVEPENYSFNGEAIEQPMMETPVVETPVVETPMTPVVETPVDNTGITNPQNGTGQFRYGEALQKSFLFFEANRSGELPDDNRIEWRGDSATNDGSDVGVDLTGGYYDAGDHVKFGFPMSANNTMLAWGGIEYEDAYREAGQFDELLEAVKWGTDYFLKAHVSNGGQTERFYVQVGDGHADHAYWGPPEEMTMDRPAFYVDAANPGSDVAANTASALASASILFRGVDNAYADELLDNARQLFEFAETYQGRYSDSVAAANPFYTSFSGYWDELTEGAAWMYKATGEQHYLDTAENYFNNHIGGLGDWSWAADDKSYSAAVLLAQESDNPRYSNEVQGWLDRWINGTDNIQYTEGGLAHRTSWGSLALSSPTSFLAELYNDTVREDSRYTQFANEQIDYILGDNPRNSSYMIGFGNNYPQQPHHRSATGDAPYGQPAEHILYGALVGGPGSVNDFDYNDDRNDWVTNEVAISYNAPLTSALIQQYDNFGGDPLTETELDALVGIDANGVGF